MQTEGIGFYKNKLQKILFFGTGIERNTFICGHNVVWFFLLPTHMDMQLMLT